jgi:hypothetical protein
MSSLTDIATANVCVKKKTKGLYHVCERRYFNISPGPFSVCCGYTYRAGCMSMPHVLSASQCFMSVTCQPACSCRISMLHVLAACPCCMSLLHVLAACPCACQCCMSKLHVNASSIFFCLPSACPFLAVLICPSSSAFSCPAWPFLPVLSACSFLPVLFCLFCPVFPLPVVCVCAGGVRVCVRG